MCDICTGYADVQRQYQQARAAMLVLGRDHDPHDACECDICTLERDLYFIERHYLDDIRHLACERLHDPAATPPVIGDGWPVDELTDDDCPF